VPPAACPSSHKNKEKAHINISSEMSDFFKINWTITLNSKYLNYVIFYMIYLLTAVELTPGGSSTAHIYTQTIHRTTQLTQTIHRTTQLTNCEECATCPVFASYTLAFALQLRKKHGKPSVRVAREYQLARWKKNIQKSMHNNNT